MRMRQMILGICVGDTRGVGTVVRSTSSNIGILSRRIQLVPASAPARAFSTSAQYDHQHQHQQDLPSSIPPSRPISGLSMNLTTSTNTNDENGTTGNANSVGNDSDRTSSSAFSTDIDMIMGVGSNYSNQAAAATIISYDRSAVSSSVSSQDCDIVIVGRKSVLQQDDVMISLLKEQLSCYLELESSQARTMSMIQAMLESGIKGQSGTVSTLVQSSGSSNSNKLSICALPDKVSRNNHPMSLHTMTEQLRSECGGLDVHAGGKDVHIFVLGVKESDSQSTTTTALPGAVASAVAKAFPQYSRKTASSNKEKRKRTIHVTMLDDQTAQPVHDHTKTAQIVSDAVQMAAYLVDMPPNELTTDVYSQVCHSLLTKLNDEIKEKDDASASAVITLKEIKGEELQHQRYGGIYNVGKAAECPPRLIEMTYVPNTNAVKESDSDAPTTTALVGKAIVFDSGGLSLKSKDGMPGMKQDMGGSAGLLGAFSCAARLKYPKPLTLILCVAENAIGPHNALRNDDIITMYSGKTVEINNTDAEGRLVLGDGVAHATQPGRHNILPKLDLVIDMATLTGAQLVATGKKHAGILATSQALEQRAMEAGLASGDLCFPLLYAPELLEGEFASKVADMKNSVKDRGNAQTSCAGHFIESHLSPDYEGEWLHVDMAGPGTKEERGTGYGVGLILSLLKVPGFV
jgi:probable aminopeptidase NPEPL1